MVTIYWTLWLILALAAGLLFVTGNFTMATAVVFGVVSFGMVFFGMMSVLPTSVAHPPRPKPPVPAKSTAIKPVVEPTRIEARTQVRLKSA